MRWWQQRWRGRSLGQRGTSIGALEVHIMAMILVVAHLRRQEEEGQSSCWTCCAGATHAALSEE